MCLVKHIPIPKYLVKHIFVRAPWNCRSIETQALGIHYRGVQWMGVVLYNKLVYNIL